MYYIHGENFILNFNTILNYTLLSCIFDGPLQHDSDITFSVIILIFVTIHKIILLKTSAQVIF